MAGVKARRLLRPYRNGVSGRGGSAEFRPESHREGLAVLGIDSQQRVEGMSCRIPAQAAVQIKRLRLVTYCGCRPWCVRPGWAAPRSTGLSQATGFRNRSSSPHALLDGESPTWTGGANRCRPVHSGVRRAGPGEFDRSANCRAEDAGITSIASRLWRRHRYG